MCTGSAEAMDCSQITKLREIISASERIVFFGGAGVSTESGIPDFRSSSGIYNMKGQKIPPEEIVSHSFFTEHTAEFYDFYRKHLVYPDALPNKAHLALARLEECGKLAAVITQNIDGLHQKAGSKTVYELHGSVLRNYCLRCGKRYGVDKILSSDGVPVCSCGGVIRPDVVLYEEALDDEVIANAVSEIRKADTLIIGGTSLAVYPAAGLIYYFKGSNTVIINKSPTSADSEADLVISGPIGEVLDAAVG